MAVIPGMNLLSKGAHKKLLKRIEEDEFEVILASPPCATFSRARSWRDGGPRPVRSERYPRGFPWLQARALKNVKDANNLVDFTIKALTIQAAKPARNYILLENPEDLGRTKHQRPTSIWRWSSTRRV